MRKNCSYVFGCVLAILLTLIGTPAQASQNLDLNKIAAKGNITGAYECALRGNNKDLRTYLYTHLGTVDDIDPLSGYRLIDCAIFGNQYHTVKVLVNEFCARIDRSNKFGAYPIHFAAMRDNTDILKFLISKGADVNARTQKMAGTPLYYAAAFGSVHSVKILLQKGANPNIPAAIADKKGDLPLEIAQKLYFIVTEERDPVARYKKLKEISFPILADKNPKELERKLKEAVRILSSHSGTPGTTLAAPSGAFLFRNHRHIAECKVYFLHDYYQSKGS